MSVFAGIASADPTTAKPEIPVVCKVNKVRKILTPEQSDGVFRWKEASYGARRAYLVNLGVPTKVAEGAALEGVILAGEPTQGGGDVLLFQPRAGGAAFVARF